MSYPSSSAFAQERDEAYALEASIAVWIEDNKNLVQIAQRMALKALDLGLWEPSHQFPHPFQILPKDVFQEEGLLAHELYAYLYHPAWGHYQFQILAEDDIVLCSAPVHSPQYLRRLSEESPQNPKRFSSEAEVMELIEELGASLDPLYALDDAAESEDTDRVNACLRNMLEAFHTAIDPELAKVRGAIAEYFPRVVIKATESEDFQYVHELSHRWDMALFYAANWFVMGASGKDVDQAATQELRQHILAFHGLQLSESAFLYVAQKMLALAGWTVEVVTDSTPEEGDPTGIVVVNDDGNFAFVRPVLHAKQVTASRN